MKRGLLFLSLITLLLASCRKKEPLPDEPNADPVFYLDAMVNGQPIKLEAGNEDYFMHSSFEKNESGLFVFRGDLNKGCNNCGYAFTMLIHDYRLSAANTKIQIDSAVHTGVYLFNDKTNWPNSREVEFKPNESQSTKEYIWTVTDGSTTATYSTYSIKTTFETAKNYTVTFKSDDGTGTCIPTLAAVYKAGNSFQAGIKAVRVDTTVTFNANVTDPGTYTYAWDFGDGSSDNSANPVHRYAAGGNYLVKLTVTNNKYESCTSYYQMNLGSNCEANFSSVFYPMDYSKVFRTMTLILVDPNGKTFSTELATQQSGDQANVTEVTDYQTNSAGKSTKKLSFSFNCTLKGDAGEIRLSDAKATMAVAFE